ncbi:MAG: DUF4249 domain-containing protein, partial [Cytophagaceae bacterium]|nr:DUF4249 domain-containing protein [Gemmatimonadaceae bacterium]
MQRPMIVACSLLLAACERVVDLDVDEGPQRLVVEARLERVHGQVNGNQSIRLTTTAPYFASSTTPAARGATVEVTGNGGVVRFSESATPGTYVTNQLIVTAGSEYRLDITYEGQRYEAVATAQPVPLIDSIYLEKPKPGRFSGDSGVRVTIDVTDPADQDNWYLWDQFVDGIRQLGPDSSFKLRITAPDESFRGITIKGFQPFEGVNINAGSSVLVRQIGIPESMYLYYFALSDQVGSDGSPFSVPPASVRGNVANRTTPTRPALGYFYA